MLACSGDLPAPFAPAPKPAVEDDSLVAVAELDGRAVLIAFYAATGGGSDWTGDNWGSAEPIGTWQGVTTDEEGRVTDLDLRELGLIRLWRSPNLMVELY